MHRYAPFRAPGASMARNSQPSAVHQTHRASSPRHVARGVPVEQMRPETGESIW